MPKFRGVKTDTVRLPLTGGDWIDVRRELTIGESRRIYSEAYRATDGNNVTVDAQIAAFARAASWITAWSLLGPDGMAIAWPVGIPLRKKIEILERLDVETMLEIEAAIATHERAQEQAKNATGEVASVPTSPSVSD